MLELRKEEVGRDPADDGGAAPDVTALAREVPAGGVEQLRGQEEHGDLGDVVGGTADTGAEGTEADRGRLGDDGVRDGSLGAGEDERDDDAETGLGVVGVGVLGDRGDDTEEEEEGYVGGGTPEVDGTTAEPVGKGPGEGVGDELKA